MSPEQSAQAEENGDALRMVESMPMQQFLAFIGGALPMEWLEQLMATSAGDELAAWRRVLLTVGPERPSAAGRRCATLHAGETGR